jgi:PAS domain S-box-containing protein
VRTLSLILNFIFSPNINFRQMAPLRHVSFLGESVAIATGVPNPWMVVAQLSLVLLVIFVTDATITVWRRGDRRQALMVGGSILLFTIAGAVEGITITWGIISMPLTVSLFYQSLVAVMACELSFDVLRATALARQLQASEASMGESEERFRIVANAAPVLIWMSGMDKLCTFFNKPWLEFTGRSMEQEMGNGWAEGVHPGDLQRCLNIYTEAFDDRRPFVMQYRLRRHDGEYRWISDQGVARYDTHENFAGYIGSCVDVTELINKDAELRESEERMRLAADAVNLGIWEWDLDKDEIWATNSRRALLGWPTSGKVGFEDFISCVHPDDRNRIQEAIDDAINKHKDYDSEYRLVLPDGVVRWMATRGSLHLNANGRPMRLLGVSIDITARKQAELETKQQRDELGHLSRVAAMGELAASIAHELNQPLAGITSNASAGQRFIDRGDVDLRELHDLLGDIVSDGRRAGDVIRSLQSMVKKAAPNRQRVNLNDLVTNVARMVNPNAVLQSCKVETLLEPNLPAIEADPIQLQQVLLNLVINAFDAMSDTLAPNRKVMIATERNGHGTIRTSVRDYGSGISEETRERLFEQFFTTKAKGLGMGLAIVRSIVESHGGTIAAENADGGVGARFQFILPVNGGPPE